jgi:excisionase family DNA binding protein
MTASAPRMYTIPEVAEMCRLSVSQIWALTRSGEIRSVKIGWSRRVPADAVDEFIKGLEREQPAAGGAA